VSLSAAEARRLAVAAQGFADPRPRARPGTVHLRRVIDRLGVVQIDSVNVLARAHYLTLFTRLGAYDPRLLDGAAYADRERTLFEYWGHEASLMPVALQPLFRWRMAEAERGVGLWRGITSFARRRRAFVEVVLREVSERGPIAASELTVAGRRRGPWWGWSDGKRALEWLFWTGRVTTATRRRFERVYDLPHRVLPAAVLDAPTPAPDEAQRALLRLAARALGVATERDLRDYFRFDGSVPRVRLAELVEAGELIPATVEGWAQPAYLHPGSRVPRRVEARALLAPFDSLIWERQRTERLFGFRYRISIYTPAAQREHGYYVLPFLLGDRLVARVDLKADRATGTLRVLSAHGEPGAPPARVAAALRAELAETAAWLGLERIALPRRGDLAAALRAHARGVRPGPGARSNGAPAPRD
jgi:uncharacterized protein YcaQ